MSSLGYPYCLFSNTSVELIAVGRTIIGRSLLPMEQVNIVNLESPRCAVSRIQAEIIVNDNGDAWVKDWDSTNGTFIANNLTGNGIRLAEKHYYQLSPGTHLTFGDVEREFKVYSEELYENLTKLHVSGNNAVSSRDTDKLHSNLHSQSLRKSGHEEILESPFTDVCKAESYSDDMNSLKKNSCSVNRDNAEIKCDMTENVNLASEQAESREYVREEKINETVINRNDWICSSDTHGKEECRAMVSQAASETPKQLISMTRIEINNELEQLEDNKCYTSAEPLLEESQEAQNSLLYTSTGSFRETYDNNSLSISNYKEKTEINEQVDKFDLTESVNVEKASCPNNRSLHELKERSVNTFEKQRAKNKVELKQNRKCQRECNTEHGRPRKRRNAHDNSNDDDDTISNSNNSNNEEFNKSSFSSCEDHTWKWDELQVCLSGMNLTEKGKVTRQICKLGGSVVEEIVDAACLIVHTPAIRTPKVIIAVGRGIPVVDSTILEHTEKLTLQNFQDAMVTIRHEGVTYAPQLLFDVIFRKDKRLMLENRLYNISLLPASIRSIAKDIISKCGGCVICNKHGNRKKMTDKVTHVDEKKLSTLYEQIMRGERIEEGDIDDEI